MNGYVSIFEAGDWWSTELEYLYSYAWAPDHNGDGVADLLVGSLPRYNSTRTGGGWLIPGPLPEPSADIPLRIEDWAIEFVGETGEDFAGQAVASGDLDGDGLSDLLIGAPFSDRLAPDGGAIYVFFGSTATQELPSQRPLADADLILAGDVKNMLAGWSLAMAGDINGDGYEDLLIGAPGDYGSQLLLGPILRDSDTRILPLSRRWDVLFTEGPDDMEGGWSVAGVGDVNGDGYADFMLGDPTAYTHGYDGAAFLFLGPLDGVGARMSIRLRDADAVLYGTTGTNSYYASGSAGYSVAGAGDVNGDGFDDLLVGDPGARTPQCCPGAAHLVLGAASIVTEEDHERSLTTAEYTFWGTTIGWPDDAPSEFGVGRAVASVGDLDGDGLSDIMIGEPEGSLDGAAEGVVHIICGCLLSSLDTRGDVDLIGFSGYMFPDDVANSSARLGSAIAVPAWPFGSARQTVVEASGELGFFRVKMPEAWR